MNCLAALLGGSILRARRCAGLADAVARRPVAATLAGAAVFALWAGLWTLDAEGSRAAEIAAWTAHGILFVLLFCGCTGLAWLAGRLVRPRLPTWAKLTTGALVVSAALLVPVAGMFLLAGALVLAFGSTLVWSHGLISHSRAAATEEIR